MDWTRFLTVSGRTLSAAHFSMSCGGMWLYASRLSTVSGSNCMESMNWLWRSQPGELGINPAPAGVHLLLKLGLRLSKSPLPTFTTATQITPRDSWELAQKGQQASGQRGRLASRCEHKGSTVHPLPDWCSPHTYSRTSFLSSILAITSRSSLAFSSLWKPHSSCWEAHFLGCPIPPLVEAGQPTPPVQ